MRRAGGRRSVAFGPRALSARLAELLPDFPQVSVCVAFSGGADSTALLGALAALARAPLELRAIHIDHRLHPHSRRWSAHCARVARALAVPLTVLRATVAPLPGESLEAAARTVRYRLLGEALRDGETLLTAHHEDDQLETVLLQLLRGAGLAGIAAMPARAPLARGFLVRPLLAWSRQELIAYLRARGLEWIEDPMNSELRLDRNYLRARVLPAIRERWPAAATTVTRTARHAAEAQRLLDELGRADVARAAFGARLSAKVLRALTPERRRNALRYWMTAAGYRPPPASRLEEIAGPVLAARSDARPRVSWPGAVVLREADLLSLCASPGPGERASSPPPGASPLPEVSWSWGRGRSRVLPGYGGRLTLKPDERGPLDLEALPATLTVRGRRGGERLRPVRGGPHRALKSLMQEARVPVAERGRRPLVYAGDTLIAVAGLWLDESVQASEASRRRARLVWSAAD